MEERGEREGEKRGIGEKRDQFIPLAVETTCMCADHNWTIVCPLLTFGRLHFLRLVCQHP